MDQATAIRKIPDPVFVSERKADRRKPPPFLERAARYVFANPPRSDRLDLWASPRHNHTERCWPEPPFPNGRMIQGP